MFHLKLSPCFRKFGLLSLGLWCLSASLSAQNLNLLNFIRPNVSFFGNYAPSYTLRDDTVSFSEYQAGLSLNLPLRTQLDFKDGLLKAKGKAWLANVNARYRVAETQVAQDLGPLASLSLGVTGIRASLGRGIWIYNFGGGFVEEINGFGGESAFGYGAFTKLKIRGLRKVNALGLGVIFGQRLVLPFPIIGWFRRYKRKQTLTAVFPLFLRYSKKLSKKWSFRLDFNVNGFSGGLSPNANSLYSAAPSGERLLLRHSHFRATTGLYVKLKKRWRLGLDVGGNLPTLLQVKEGREDLFRGTGIGTGYASLNLRYRFKMPGIGKILKDLLDFD